MTNDTHVELLKQGVAAWNEWRDKNPSILPDLRGANLSDADLREANLKGANLREANLSDADLREANLSDAYLSKANLSGAELSRAELKGANLSGADLSGAELGWANFAWANLSDANLREAFLAGARLSDAYLREADLSGANLRGADLSWSADLSDANLSDAKLDDANLVGAKLTGAKLRDANLRGANLRNANLCGANLRGANLSVTQLVRTDLTDADVTGCRIYGISAWDVKLERAKQQSLVISTGDEPAITVDNIEVAQFIYLMLHNEKIRDIIDTIGKKAVLILGRFTPERKAILDALREELRKYDYLPILFDFEVPAGGNVTETVTLLARMARFIIADLTDSSSIPQELQAIVPHLAKPVQPLLEGASRPYAMFRDYRMYDWVLPVHRYGGLDSLLATLAEKIIAPAEEKVKDLRRRMIEAELTKPQ
jgi:uncharacterized protein YjbI with pentapeptide repeats